MSVSRAQAQLRKAGAGDLGGALANGTGGRQTSRRLWLASALRELRLLVAPALGDWSKVMQIVVILVTVFLGVTIVLFLGAVAAKSVDWQVPHVLAVPWLGSPDGWSR